MSKPDKTVEVTLLRPHTSGGQNYPEGAKIKVSPAIVDWMANRKIIAKPAASKSA